MTTTIKNTNNASLTIKMEQLVNGVYVTLAEQIINASESLSLDFITQSTNYLCASFLQNGTGMKQPIGGYKHNLGGITNTIWNSDRKPLNTQDKKTKLYESQ